MYIEGPVSAFSLFRGDSKKFKYCSAVKPNPPTKQTFPNNIFRGSMIPKKSDFSLHNHTPKVLNLSSEVHSKNVYKIKENILIAEVEFVPAPEELPEKMEEFVVAPVEFVPAPEELPEKMEEIVVAPVEFVSAPEELPEKVGNCDVVKTLVDESAELLMPSQISKKRDFMSYLEEERSVNVQLCVINPKNDVLLEENNEQSQTETNHMEFGDLFSDSEDEVELEEKEEIGNEGNGKEQVSYDGEDVMMQSDEDIMEGKTGLEVHQKKPIKNKRTSKRWMKVDGNVAGAIGFQQLALVKIENEKERTNTGNKRVKGIIKKLAEFCILFNQNVIFSCESPTKIISFSSVDKSVIINIIHNMSPRQQ